MLEFDHIVLASLAAKFECKSAGRRVDYDLHLKRMNKYRAKDSKTEPERRDDNDFTVRVISKRTVETINRDWTLIAA